MGFHPPLRPAPPLISICQVGVSTLVMHSARQAMSCPEAPKSGWGRLAQALQILVSEPACSRGLSLSWRLLCGAALRFAPKAAGKHPLHRLHAGRVSTCPSCHGISVVSCGRQAASESRGTLSMTRVSTVGRRAALLSGLLAGNTNAKNYVRTRPLHGCSWVSGPWGVG